MKWNKQWLFKQKNGKFEFEEDLIFPKESWKHIHNLDDIKNVHVSGDGYFNDKDQKVYINLTVSGIFVIPCALSLEPVDSPFHIESTEVFTFVKPDLEAEEHKATGDTIDLTPIVFQNMITEIPLRVVKEGAKYHREGKGWSIISDSKEIDNLEMIDPRLAKLKDYFKEKE